MNKAEKQQYIENLDQMSKDYSAVFVASFSKMSVKEMIEFRTEIRNNDGVTKVSKNNIVKIFVNKDEEKKVYSELFKKYFLKSFSSRLAEYTNPEIDVQSKETLSENYTIVNSLLKGTPERPEVKIDWRIYTKNPEKPLIRDLIIEGLSLARTQKEEFNSIIQSADGDMEVLFTSLRNFSNK